MRSGRRSRLKRVTAWRLPSSATWKALRSRSSTGWPVLSRTGDRHADGARRRRRKWARMRPRGSAARPRAAPAGRAAAGDRRGGAADGRRPASRWRRPCAARPLGRLVEGLRHAARSELEQDRLLADPGVEEPDEVRDGERGLSVRSRVGKRQPGQDRDAAPRDRASHATVPPSCHRRLAAGECPVPRMRAGGGRRQPCLRPFCGRLTNRTSPRAPGVRHRARVDCTEPYGAVRSRTAARRPSRGTLCPSRGFRRGPPLAAVEGVRSEPWTDPSTPAS